MPGGRPSKYQDEYCEQAYKLCLLGATDTELADFFCVTESTINKWKLDYEQFSESLKKGKSTADSMVAEKLFRRALGYSHPEDKIFNNQGVEMIVETIKHYPPDTTAAIFWLKNRQKDKWRDQRDIIGNVNHEHKHTHESVSNTTEWIEGLLKGAANSKNKEPRPN